MAEVEERLDERIERANFEGHRLSAHKDRDAHGDCDRYHLPRQLHIAHRT